MTGVNVLMSVRDKAHSMDYTVMKIDSTLTFTQNM